MHYFTVIIFVKYNNIIYESNVTPVSYTHLDVYKRQAQNLTIGEENIEMVERFTYLGVEMTRDGSEEGEIRRRVTLANKAYFSLSQVFRSKAVSYTHLDVYKRQVL